MSETVPDYMIDPPEDDREIVATCEECGEVIYEGEEVLYSQLLQVHLCDINCLKANIGIVDTYY